MTTFTTVFWFLPWFFKFYQVLLGITGFYWVSLGFTEFYRVLPSFSGFYCFTVFYWVLPGFTGFYWVLLGFTGFYWALPGFTGFYFVLLCFTGFYRFSLGFTGSHYIMNGNDIAGRRIVETKVWMECVTRWFRPNRNETRLFNADAHQKKRQNKKVTNWQAIYFVGPQNPIPSFALNGNKKVSGKETTIRSEKDDDDDDDDDVAYLCVCVCV